MIQKDIESELLVELKPKTYTIGQQVELLILRETPLGYSAQINNQDEGLLYHNEIFERLENGDKLPGFVRNIRPDGGVDLILQPIGHHSSDQIGVRIIEALEDANGRIEINNKTTADEIYKLFGVSKKKYKMALGGLYKKRLVKITDSTIELVHSPLA